jgi:hypothetical protein
MAKRSATRILSDAFMKARMPGAKAARVSLIRNGIKYRAGKPPVRVCPAVTVMRKALARPV